MEAPLIYSTIAQVMKKVNAISKGRKNTQQNFAYRGIDDVMNELHPIMAECGLFVVPTVLEENRTEGRTKAGSALNYTRLKIKFTFYAGDGSSIEAVVIGEAMDSGDKASNKALAIGLKYALLQVFCIPTEDEKDPDAESPVMEPRQNGTQNKAPAQRKATVNNVKLAGGNDTPAEHDEICALLGSKDMNGKAVFTQNEIDAVPDMRTRSTAAQVIAFLKDELKNRLSAGQNPEPNPPTDAPGPIF